MSKSIDRPPAAQVIFQIDRWVADHVGELTKSMHACLSKIRSLAAGRRDGLVGLQTSTWANDLGLDPSSIRRAIRQLVRLGLLAEAGKEICLGGYRRLLKLCLSFGPQRAATPARPGSSTWESGQPCPPLHYKEEQTKEDDDEEDAVVVVLAKVGVPKAEAKRMASSHTLQQIEQALRCLLATKKPIANVSGYLSAALKGNWEPGIPTPTARKTIDFDDVERRREAAEAALEAQRQAAVAQRMRGGR